MKKLITGLLAVSAIAAVAVPATAQPGPGPGRGGPDGRYGDRDYGDFRERYERLERRIERGVATRQLSRREAARLTEELRQLRRLDRQYRYSEGRLTRFERQDLERRLDRLERRFREDRRDYDRRPG